MVTRKKREFESTQMLASFIRDMSFSRALKRAQKGYVAVYTTDKGVERASKLKTALAKNKRDAV